MPEPVRRCVYDYARRAGWDGCHWDAPGLADKAIIKEIIGDFCGEKVGISVFDKTTAYYAGDEVKIDDFDMRNEECSTGFHFFCTREEAEAY